jgi:nucleotidyltransferase substrate binding protein (TIGR01987 family)
VGGLNERLKAASKAVLTLAELIQLKTVTPIERDATIQRFEYSFETVWKAAKHYLREKEGIDVASPKGVIRACREIGLLNEEEAVHALEMADDRNLTVHTYNDRLAQEIFMRIKVHYPLLETWLKRLEEKSNEEK